MLHQINNIRKNKRFHYLLVAITFLFIPLIFLTYRLTENPPGFFIDESLNGYEAYHILATKGYSSNGEFLPRLFYIEAGGEKTRNHHSFIYFIVPFITLFGVTEFAVRFTSVFASIACLFTIYLLLRDKVSRRVIFLVALCWPITAWVFLVSRIGMEFMTTAWLFILALFFLDKLSYEKQQHNFRYSILLGITLFALFYVYAAGKILAVGLMIMASWIAYKRQLSWQYQLILIGFFSMTFLTAYPYVLDGTFFYRAKELAMCKEPLDCFLSNLGSHFNFFNYFGNTFRPHDFRVYTHSIIGTSLIPLFLSPLILLGIVIFIRNALNKDRFSLLILASSVLAIIPASLTIRGFDTYRSVALLPLLFIFIIYGMDFFLSYIKKKKSIRSYHVRVVLLVLFFILCGVLEARRLFTYEYYTLAAYYGGWQYGYRQVFTYLKEQYNHYDAVIVTPRVAYVAGRYIKFFDYKETYPNISVGRINPSWEGKILYVVRAEEFRKMSSKNFLIKKTILYPNQRDVVFYIGEYKQ